MQEGSVRTVVAVTGGGHLLLVLLGAAVLGWGERLDPLGPVALGALYASPALLALLALRARRRLLLAAAVSSLVLAVVPFSVHSFVLGPAGLTYAGLYARMSSRQRDPVPLLTVVACPLLQVAALVALLQHEDPACYTEHQDGEVTIDRSPAGSTTDSRTAGPDTVVVAQGCTSDTVVWWEAAAGLGLTSAAVALGLLPPPRLRDPVPERS
ncbi:hypothetical protein [Ornithinicoccus halotolerans]|uniref:hypothetical protein n=1 Tax=Ornithinicoccus halotolerans TaxID=1748220 RepID=UPI0012961A83|nr:hypothetical protein [Ornithinicoccus halotolerans]